MSSTRGSGAQVRILGKGDAFMILSAMLYGFTNATEEFFVKRPPLYEVIGQLGMWGTLINGIQASALEHHDMTLASWNGAADVGFFVAYTAAMFFLYTTAPLLYRSASSPFYDIGMLTSDFYGLLFVWIPGLFLFVLMIAREAEEQGKVDPRRPAYIQRRQEEQV
ncbi:hypothetical protein EDD17DRAFT_1902364 [Pisolithus thermaeus]|nr:hypothetical protein EDD17DRAFT_1902364 [Pisolithus thermaeus]